MKTMRCPLVVVLLLLAAFPASAEPDAKESFEKLKSLAGSWEGRMTTVPKVPGMDGTLTQVTLRVTSMGHTLMHEMTGEGRPDNPITMLYLEDDSLALTHYCDAGNRPRMTGHISPEGKSFHFEFADMSGGDKYGHMHGAAFTFIDADHHSEEWTFMMPGGKAVRAQIDLRRKQ